MGGKTRAAQAHQAGAAGRGGQLLLRGDGRGGIDGRVLFHFSVRADDHRLGHLSAGEHDRGELLHRARDGGVHRCGYISVAVAYHSAHKDRVPLFYSGDTGGAKMLLHGQDDPFRGRHGGSGKLPCILVVGHRRSAVSAEGMLWKFHDDTSLSYGSVNQASS